MLCFRIIYANYETLILGKFSHSLPPENLIKPDYFSGYWKGALAWNELIKTCAHKKLYESMVNLLKQICKEPETFYMEVHFKDLSH